MSDYINREEILKKLKGWHTELEADKDKGYADELAENKGEREAIECCIAEVETLPSADVQSVDRWISVDDSLPPDNIPCVVVTKNNGLGVSRLMGRNKLEWTLFGKPVLYWMPVPEPPKDGEQK